MCRHRSHHLTSCSTDIRSLIRTHAAVCCLHVAGDRCALSFSNVFRSNSLWYGTLTLLPSTRRPLPSRCRRSQRCSAVASSSPMHPLVRAASLAYASLWHKSPPWAVARTGTSQLRGLRSYRLRARLLHRALHPTSASAVAELLAGGKRGGGGGRGQWASAVAGSGKTAAFVVPMICLLKLPANQGPRGLIISPTRELALQVKVCLG